MPLLIREIRSQENIRNEKMLDRSRSIFPIHGRELENILFPRMDTRRVIIKRAAVSIYPDVCKAISVREEEEEEGVWSSPRANTSKRKRHRRMGSV